MEPNKNIQIMIHNLKGIRDYLSTVNSDPDTTAITMKALQAYQDDITEIIEYLAVN